jgi:hypothetical protein
MNYEKHGIIVSYKVSKYGDIVINFNDGCKMTFGVYGKKGVKTFWNKQLQLIINKKLHSINNISGICNEINGIQPKFNIIIDVIDNNYKILSISNPIYYDNDDNVYIGTTFHNSQLH